MNDMNQSEFNFLVTNVTAIATQTFSIRCGEFGAAMAADESNDIPTAEFNLEEQHEYFDYQAILNSGYRDIDSLVVELDGAWQILDQDMLDSLLTNLLDELPLLQKEISGDDLKLWISHSLDASNDSPFFLLNQYIMALFQQDDDIHDLIREAIASNSIDELEEEEAKIFAKHILIKDLVTAAEIESFETFKWLFEKSELNEQQLSEMFSSEGCIDDQFVFETIYNIVSPSEQLKNTLKLIAEEQGHQTVVQFLEQGQTV